MSRRIVKENIHLKRQNKELKERLDFTERLLDQILRDQDEKRKLEKTVEATANRTMERKPSKKKNVSVQSNIISTKNRYDSLESEEEKSDEGDESQTEFWPIDLKNRDHGENQSFSSKGKKTLIPKVVTITIHVKTK